MSEVLKIIDNLRKLLMNEYGNVLEGEYTQSEIHDTYYVSDLLKQNGLGHDENYLYTQKSVNAAFIAGRRVERRNQEMRHKEDIESALNDFRSIKQIVEGWL